MKSKIILFSIMLGLGAFFISHQVQAADAEKPTGHLVASPSIDKLGELSPGKSYTRTISASNTSDKEIKFSLTPIQFKAQDDKYEFAWGISDSQYGKIASWTNLDSKKIYSVKPGETEKVKYTINVPADYTGGAQHMMLSLKLIKDQKKSSGFQMETVLNLQVYSNISGNLHPKSKILSTHIPAFSTKPFIRTSSSLENTGNADLNIRYKLNIHNAFSGDLAYEALDEKMLMPESTRIFEQNWNNAPMLGVFKVRQEIAHIEESGKEAVVSFEKLVIICPIWLILIFLAIIILIVLRCTVFNKKSRSLKKSKKDLSL